MNQDWEKRLRDRFCKESDKNRHSVRKVFFFSFLEVIGSLLIRGVVLCSTSALRCAISISAKHLFLKLNVFLLQRPRDNKAFGLEQEIPKKVIS